MRLLRRWLGLDDPPLPSDREVPVNGVSEAEKHFADAVQDARQAMGRAEVAHQQAVSRARQNAIADALLRARNWEGP